MEKIIIHIHSDVHIHVGCDACENFFDDSGRMEDEFKDDDFGESKDEYSDEEPVLVFCAFDNAPEPIPSEKARDLNNDAALFFRFMKLDKRLTKRSRQ